MHARVKVGLSMGKQFYVFENIVKIDKSFCICVDRFMIYGRDYSKVI